MKRTVSAAGFVSEDEKRPWEGSTIRAYEYTWQFHHGKSIDNTSQGTVLNMRTEPAQDFCMLRSNWDQGIYTTKSVSGVTGNVYLDSAGSPATLAGGKVWSLSNTQQGNAATSNQQSMQSSLGDTQALDSGAFGAVVHEVPGPDVVSSQNGNNTDKTLLGLRMDQFYITHLIPNCDIRQGCCLPHNYGKPTIEFTVANSNVPAGETWAFQFDQGYYDFPTLAANLATCISYVLTLNSGTSVFNGSANQVTITYDRNRGCCVLNTSAWDASTTLSFPSYNEDVEYRCNRTVRTMLGLPRGVITNFVSTSDTPHNLSIVLAKTGYTPSDTGVLIPTTLHYGYQGVDMNRPKSICVCLGSNSNLLQNISVDNMAGSNSIMAVVPLSQSFGELVFWESNPHTNPVFVDRNSQDGQGASQIFQVCLKDERGAPLINGRAEWGGSGALFMRNRLPVRVL